MMKVNYLKYRAVGEGAKCDDQGSVDADMLTVTAGDIEIEVQHTRDLRNPDVLRPAVVLRYREITVRARDGEVVIDGHKKIETGAPVHFVTRDAGAHP